jgi:hypothetical protein
MKKFTFSLLASVVISLVNLSTINAQAVRQGNVITDIYYGFPNLYSAVFRAAYANSGSEVGLEIGGIGPIGLRAEYMVADKIGIGLDVGFNNSIISYSEESSVYNQNTGVYDPITYQYNFSTQKIGAIATFNFHFIENDKVDAYAVFGAGYGNRSFKFESSDPSYTPGTVKSLVPVSSKIGVGVRYFFTENIGANLALGFGQGGLFNVGLSAKF